MNEFQDKTSIRTQTVGFPHDIATSVTKECLAISSRRFTITWLILDWPNNSTPRNIVQVTTQEKISARLKRLTALLILVLLPFSQSVAQTPDPWEPLNQRIFSFNDFFDTNLVVPLSKGYTNIVPRAVRTGVNNFFNNIGEINVAVNDLLQLKIGDAASDTGRFLINSTIGLGGVLDVATPLGLERNDEDWGQTFGYWGIQTGPYFVIPTVGSSSVRDTAGFVLDAVFNPLLFLDSELTGAALYATREIDDRSRLLALDNLIFGDKYIFYRDAYFQRREYQINDGVVEDEFGDFDF
jgi:phospholipid-binding lipoprotein MlaA